MELIGGAKGRIIDILSRKCPLSAQSIYMGIRKQKACTYQAVHKILHDMTQHGILIKENRNYALNIDWIKALKQYCNLLDKSCSGGEQTCGTFEFRSPSETWKFIIRRFLKLPNPDKKIAVFNWWHLYTFLGFSKEELATVKAFTNRNPLFILCQKCSAFDKVLLKSYKELGAKVVFGIEGIGCPDFFVHGDFVGELHLSKEYRKKREEIHKIYGTEHFNLNTLLAEVHEKKYGSVITVRRDPVLADFLRTETLKWSTRNQQQKTNS